MPAGRILLKSISESKKLSKLKTDSARLLYTWLIPHLDINGCFSGDAEVIKGKIFTRLKKSNKTVEGYLQDLERVKLIVRYEVNGDVFLYSPDFVKKQPSLNPKKEGKPLIPLPAPELLQTNSRQTPEKVSTSKVKESKVKVNESKEKAESLNEKLFKDFWEAYPKKVAKDVAKEKFMILIRKGLSKELIKGFNGYVDYLKMRKVRDNFDQEALNPATFLMKNRWKDYVDFKYSPPL